MRHLYIYIHIPKNAGTTFNRILKRLFEKRLVYVPEAKPGSVLTPGEKSAVLARHRQARCLTSHTFRYPAPPLPGVEHRYLTFFRHPVERLLSLYAYERKIEAAHPAHSSQLPIEEWIDSRLQDDNALVNYQTYHLLGLSQPGELDLDQARRLVDRFFFVGIVERFDESLLLLARQMARPIYDFHFRKLNVTRAAERVTIRPAVRQRLLDLNLIDLQLYQYACSRFEQELAGIPPQTLEAQARRLARVNEVGPAALPVWLRISRRLRFIFAR